MTQIVKLLISVANHEYCYLFPHDDGQTASLFFAHFATLYVANTIISSSLTIC